jgi:hypothetical protein
MEERQVQMHGQMQELRRANVTLKEQLMELESADHSLDSLEAELFEERERSARERKEYRGKIAELEQVIQMAGQSRMQVEQELTRALTAQSNLEAVVKTMEEERQLLEESQIVPLQQRVRGLQAALEERERERDGLRRQVEEQSLKLDKLSELEVLQEQNHRLRQELSVLRDRLDESLTKWKSAVDSDDTTIDRTLVKQALIQYVSRKHDQNVLELMLRLLQFTNEDRARLRSSGHASSPSDHHHPNGAAPTGPRKWSSWLGSGIGSVLNRGVSVVAGVGGSSDAVSSSSLQREDMEQANLSDLFLQYLMKETEQQQQQPRVVVDGPTQPSVPPATASTPSPRTSSPLVASSAIPPSSSSTLLAPSDTAVAAAPPSPTPI